MNNFRHFKMGIAISCVHTARSILIIILSVFYYVVLYTQSHNNMFYIRHDLPKFNYVPSEFKTTKHFRQIPMPKHTQNATTIHSNRYKHYSKCQNTYIIRVGKIYIL